MAFRWRLRRLDSRLPGKRVTQSSRFLLSIPRCPSGIIHGFPWPCLFHSWPGTARPGDWLVRPVVLVAIEVELQMLPVGGSELLSLDFARHRFEVAQTAHRAGRRPLDQGHPLAHAAKQDGVLDGFLEHAGVLLGRGETLVGGV